MFQIKQDLREAINPFVSGKRSSTSISLKNKLTHDLALARQRGETVAVFAVRIDRHDDLLAELGHEVLERLLVRIAKRLGATIGPADSMGRFRHGSFAVVQPMTPNAFAGYRAAQKMLSSLQHQMRIAGDDRCLDINIGISFYPADGNTASHLLERAYAALRRAERWGGNGFCFHSPSAAKAVADALAMDVDLRRALHVQAVDMRFQPVLDMDQASMVAVVGQLFWQHPVRGRLTMSDIMPSAERAGLLPMLNGWLANRIRDQSDLWRRKGLHQRISIRASRSQIVDAGLAAALSAAFGATGVPAGRVEISIDHGLLLDETDHRLRTGLQQLADLGIELTAANVGAEPLSFQSLTALPIGCVELAPSMIATIGRCSSSEAILDAMIAFIHGLGLRVRAVGTEVEEQFDFLQRHGCDELAGPLLAPALKAGDISRLTGIKPCFLQQRSLANTERKLLSLH